ncbi:MAG: hypothetical protein ABSD97_13170, partial [Acidimicrobiales bacterium]
MHRIVRNIDEGLLRLLHCRVHAQELPSHRVVVAAYYDSTGDELAERPGAPSITVATYLSISRLPVPYSSGPRFT